MKIPPPRLHIIFASNASYAVILRRGPSKHVATFGWDLTNNTIELGQWFYGRIYEHRSSLSHDGKYFLYAAMNCKWDSETGGIWAAISKTPYIKAIELYSDVPEMGGGGLFVSNNEYYLNEIFFEPTKFLKKSSEFFCLSKPDQHCMYGTKGVYIERLLQRGWKFEKRIEHEKYHTTLVLSKIIFDGMTIYKNIINKYPAKKTEWEEHTLIAGDNTVYFSDHWECADVIGNTIYFTELGLLMCIEVTSDPGNLEEKIIHDFSGYQFEAIEAPY